MYYGILNILDIILIIIIIFIVIHFQIKSGISNEVSTVVGGPFSRTEMKMIWRDLEQSTNCEVSKYFYEFVK